MQIATIAGATCTSEKNKNNIIASGIAGHNVAAASGLAGRWGIPSSKKIHQNDSNKLALFDLSLLSNRTTKWPKWRTTVKAFMNLYEQILPLVKSVINKKLDIYIFGCTLIASILGLFRCSDWSWMPTTTFCTGVLKASVLGVFRCCGSGRIETTTL